MHGGGDVGGGHAGGGHVPGHTPHSGHPAAHPSDSGSGNPAAWYTEAARYGSRSSYRNSRIAAAITLVVIVAGLIVLFSLS
jgi:hypothetical protein